MDHTEQQHHQTPEGAGPGYETRDTDPRAVIGFGVGMVVAIIVVQLVLLAVYKVLEREPGPEPAKRAPIDLYEQLAGLRKSEDETLTSYGWVDRKAGVVRIPIERALDLVAERGVPKGKGPRTLAEMNSHAGIPAQAVEKEQAKEKGQEKEKAKDKKPSKDQDKNTSTSKGAEK
jgi:hypothetical protein